MAEEVTAEQEFDSAWEDTPVEEPETETSEEGWEEPAEETPEDELESGQDEDPEEGAKEEQRRKSWEGRLKKREEELKAKELELMQLQQQAQSGEQRQEPTVETDEEDPDWQAMVDDLGEDLALRVRNQSQKVTQKALQAEIDKVRRELSEQITPLTQRQEQERAERHYQTIKQSHPDAIDLVKSGEVQQWVEEQPRYLQPAYQRVMEEGSAEDVVEMLDTFKQSRGKPAQNQSKAPPQQAVRSRKGGRVRTAATPKDDFDSAWDEAVRE